MRFLSDRNIREALEQGWISTSHKIPDSHIQPATLDARIGDVIIYDENYREKESLRLSNLSPLEALDYEPSKENSIFIPYKHNQKFTLGPNDFAEIYLHEDFKANDYIMHYALRSSRGRLSLARPPISGYFPPMFDEGSQFIPIFNHNPNPITLEQGTKFAQIFFAPKKDKPADGRIVTDEDEVLEIANKISDAPIVDGKYFVLSAGNKIMKFKNDRGDLDTNSLPKSDDLYEHIDLRKNSMIYPGDATILPLKEKLNLPDDTGLYIIQNLTGPTQNYLTGPDPRHLEIETHSCNAGWVDPGYNGHVTAHPKVFKGPAQIKPGQPMALGVFIKYDKPVLRPYGSKALNSHYQNSTGVGSNN